LGEMLQGKDRGPRLDGSHDDRVQADPPGCSEHSLIAIVASSVIASGGRWPGERRGARLWAR